MSRTPDGVYHLPGGFDAVKGVPLQPVESVDYNSVILDLEADANIARPIVAGGTGATSAAGARDQLDAEVASQNVTDFNTHVFESGSFVANNAAVNGPVAAHNYYGTAYVFDANNVLIEARDLNDTSGAVPSRKYLREKKAGSWGAWVNENTVYNAGGGLVLLQTQDAVAAASIIFNNTVINSTYDHYMFDIIDCGPNTDAQAIEMALSNDNGASFTANNYAYSQMLNDAAAASLLASNNNGTATALFVSGFTLTNAFGAGKQSSITVDLFSPATGKEPLVHWRCCGWRANGNLCQAYGVGSRLGWSPGTVNAVRFRAQSGTFNGKCKLYGVKKALP